MARQPPVAVDATRPPPKRAAKHAIAIGLASPDLTWKILAHTSETFATWNRTEFRMPAPNGCVRIYRSAQQAAKRDKEEHDETTIFTQPRAMRRKQASCKQIRKKGAGAARTAARNLNDVGNQCLLQQIRAMPIKRLAQRRSIRLAAVDRVSGCPCKHAVEVHAYIGVGVDACSAIHDFLYEVSGLAW